MTIEQKLLHIDDLIKQAHRLGQTEVHICFWDQAIAVREKHHTSKPHHVLMDLTSEQVKQGLTPAERDELRSKIEALNAQ